MDRRRHGNALILVLGIALLLAIQIYIIQTLTVGSFRHVEKVNALIRAIYVGEAAFSQVLAKIKVDTWENRWFKGQPDGAREYGVSLAGGTYASVVVEVTGPGVTEKLVDVWLEARYEGSTQLMFYRVLYSDDTLDFTAQVYPRFFTFLEANDPNPFAGALAPATANIQALINEQVNHEPAAIAAINGVRGTCDLAGVTASLGVAMPGPGLDTLTPPGGSPLDLCTYVNGVAGSLTPLGIPPPPPPVPPTPPTPPAGANFFDAMVNSFAANAGGAVLPTANGQKVTDPRALALLSDTKEGEKQWKTEHFDKGFEHYMKMDELIGFIDNMLAKRDAAPASAQALQINQIVTDMFTWINAKSAGAGGRTYVLGTIARAAVVSELLATQRELPPLIPEFREK